MIGSAIMGLNYTIAAPEELWPEEALFKECKELAKESGSEINLTAEIKKGVKAADAIYTDVWVSMGEESQFEKRIELLTPYQVNMEMLKMTENPDVIFLHCLPAYHNTETENGKKIYEKFGLDEMEVTEEVFESNYSKVFDQAENRMHTIKAVMTATL
jgi:ornithine carbamoyltransferase